MCPSSSSSQWFCGNMPAMDGHWWSSRIAGVRTNSATLIKTKSVNTLIMMMRTMYTLDFLYVPSRLSHQWLCRNSCISCTFVATCRLWTAIGGVHALFVLEPTKCIYKVYIYICNKVYIYIYMYISTYINGDNYKRIYLMHVATQGKQNIAIFS